MEAPPDAEQHRRSSQKGIGQGEIHVKRLSEASERVIDAGEAMRLVERLLGMLSEHEWAPKQEQTAPPGPAEPAIAGSHLVSLLLAENLGRLERELIVEALRRSAGNRTRAAKLLGVSRNGLAIKMSRLGLTPGPG